MASRVGALRDRLLSGTESALETERVLETIEDRLESDEFVHQHLLGKTGYIIYEENGETENLTVEGPAHSVSVVTDRKLLFGVFSTEETLTREVPHVDIKDVDVDDGLLRSTLSVCVWPTGQFQLSIKDSTALGAAVSTLVPVSECWQYTVSMLEAASERIPAVGEAIEKGELGTVRTERTAVETKLRQSRERVEQTVEKTEIDALPALAQRIEATERELYRTEMHARVARASGLLATGKQCVESREYTEAVEQFWTARDHLENARMLARRAAIDEPSVIDTRLDRVENALEAVRVMPLAQAKQTRERADGVDSWHKRVELLQETFEQYRDALTAGWGTDFEFAGEKQTIREDIQAVLKALTEVRCQYARTLADRALEHKEAGRDEQAVDIARRAHDQLTAAKQLSREFRAADSNLVDQTITEVASQLSN